MVRGRAALLIQRLELDGSIDALNALQCVHYVGVNSFGGSDPRLGLRQEVANERERSGWFIRDGDHHELLQVDLQFAFISWVLLWSFSLGMHMLYTSSTNFPGKNYTSPPRDKEAQSEAGKMLQLSWDGNYDRYVVKVST